MSDYFGATLGLLSVMTGFGLAGAILETKAKKAADAERSVLKGVATAMKWASAGPLFGIVMLVILQQMDGGA